MAGVAVCSVCDRAEEMEPVGDSSGCVKRDDMTEEMADGVGREMGMELISSELPSCDIIDGPNGVICCDEADECE